VARSAHRITRGPQWRRTHIWASASGFRARRKWQWQQPRLRRHGLDVWLKFYLLKRQNTRQKEHRFARSFFKITQNPTSIPARPVIYAHASLPALLPSSLSPPLVISRHHDITQLSGPEPPTSLPLPTPPRRQGSDGPAGGHQLAVVVLAQEG